MCSLSLAPTCGLCKIRPVRIRGAFTECRNPRTPHHSWYLLISLWLEYPGGFFICRNLIDSCFQTWTLAWQTRDLLPENHCSFIRTNKHTSCGGSCGLTFTAAHIWNRRLSCALDQSTIRLALAMHALSSEASHLHQCCHSNYVSTLKVRERWLFLDHRRQ